MDGRSVKYYSLRPRIEMELEYYVDYSCTFLRKKIENSRFYQEADMNRIDTLIETILTRKGDEK